MLLELGSHPKSTQIADALVYVGGYPTKINRSDIQKGAARSPRHFADCGHGVHRDDPRAFEVMKKFIIGT
jgi:hypothetical protein